MKSIFIITVIGIWMISSCKSVEPALLSSTLEKTNTCFYTIVILLKDNGSMITQVMDKIYKMDAAQNVLAIENCTLIGNIEEVHVIVSALPNSRINNLSKELYKINGVMKVSFYRN